MVPPTLKDDNSEQFSALGTMFAPIKQQRGSQNQVQTSSPSLCYNQTGMITSTHNPKIQWVRTLLQRSRHRREEQVFVVEGVRLVEEALQAGWDAQLLLHSPDLSERGLALVDGFTRRGCEVEQVSAQVMDSLSATDTPQGLLAVLPKRDLPLPAVLDFVLIADELRDPGNLGTILRTAAAAGVQAVCLSPGTADAFSPKVLRAGMGAHFRLPLFSLEWRAIESLVQQARLIVFLAEAGGGVAYTQANFRQPLALIIGGEAAGAGRAAQALARQPVFIPMPGQSESLNAAAAAAVLLFEIVRQRSAG